MLRAILTHNPSDSKRLYIIDARPRRNAVANQAKGPSRAHSVLTRRGATCRAYL